MTSTRYGEEKGGRPGGSAEKRAYIPLAIITQLDGDEDGSNLSVTYKQAEAENSVWVCLAESANRDELIEALVNRLGPTWASERKPEYAGLWASLIIAAIIAFFTSCTYSDALDIAAGKQPPENHGTTRECWPILVSCLSRRVDRCTFTCLEELKPWRRRLH